jgi:hypothetical protein
MAAHPRRRRVMSDSSEGSDDGDSLASSDDDSLSPFSGDHDSDSRSCSDYASDTSSAYDDSDNDVDEDDEALSWSSWDYELLHAIERRRFLAKIKSIVRRRPRLARYPMGDDSLPLHAAAEQ